jgi:hypothetical protein
MFGVSFSQWMAFLAVVMGLLVQCTGLKVRNMDKQSVQITETENDTYRNWMQLFFQDRPYTKLNTVAVPGTHDSATHKINRRSKIAPGESKFYLFAKKLVANFSKTQSDSIYQQLNGGIRRLDLRIDYDGKDMVIVHGMISCPLAEVLNDLQRWASENPKEIVFIELNLLPDAKYFNKLQQQIAKTIGNYSLMRNEDIRANDLTFSHFWSVRKTFLILSENGRFNDQASIYWNKYRIITDFWPKTTNRDELAHRMLNGRDDLPGLLHRNPNMINNFSITFTPDIKTIVDAIFKIKAPKSIYELSKPIFNFCHQYVLKWHREGIHINFISSDFYRETQIVECSMEINCQRFQQANSNICK